MKKGDLVVCIDTFEELWFDHLIEIPIIGKVYTVHNVHGDYIELSELLKKYPYFKDKPNVRDTFNVQTWSIKCFVGLIDFNKSEISQSIQELTK